MHQLLDAPRTDDARARQVSFICDSRDHRRMSCEVLVGYSRKSQGAVVLVIEDMELIGGASIDHTAYYVIDCECKRGLLGEKREDLRLSKKLYRWRAEVIIVSNYY